jgi:ribosomal protein S8
LQKKKLYSTKQMWIYLWRCNSETPFFSTLKIVSTPSKKYFCKFWELVCIPLKQRVYFFSTVWGFKTLYDCKKERLGGIFCFSC